jgi:t-SNARE complex subunit (syntaxin)
MTGDDEQGEKNANKAYERARRMRNYAIACILGFLVFLFFLMTIVRLGGHVAD